ERANDPVLSDDSPANRRVIKKPRFLMRANRRRRWPTERISVQFRSRYLRIPRLPHVPYVPLSPPLVRGNPQAFSTPARLARGEPCTSSAAQCLQASKPAAQTGRP